LFGGNKNYFGAMKKKKKIVFSVITFCFLIGLVFWSVFIFKKPIEQKMIEPKLTINSFFTQFSFGGSPGNLQSFTANFYHDARKDNEKSNIYQDFQTRIISFPPKYDFREISPVAQDKNHSQLETESVNIFCPEEKNTCLFLKDGKIYFTKDGKNGKEFSLPFQVSAIGKTESFWLLAESWQDEKNFFAKVYKFDGKNIFKLADEDFLKSDYPGEFILGGSDSDFLVGFYGLGSRVLRFYPLSENDYDAFWVSFWFNTKIVKELNIQDIVILKTKTGYIFYSKTVPLFLLVNGNCPVNLTKTLDLDKLQKITIEPIQKENSFLIIAFENNEPLKYFEFENLGFDKSKTLSFVSSNLTPTKQTRKIISATILDYLGKEDGGKFQFYFSTDSGENWLEVQSGETKFFDDGFSLQWRVDFVPDLKDNFLSPFLYQVGLTFAVE